MPPPTPPVRTSAQKRLQLTNLAEREVLRYAGDHAAWHKHVHGVDLDPAQVLKCMEMDANPRTIDFSCRRTGKTAVKEMYFLKELATKSDQELGIVAPREAQSLVNLNYHLDSIRRSQILQAYINFKSGRRQMADTYYQFANRSIARAYGIMANVDGGDLTVASLEEVDDMPKDRLFARFLLMMGSTRRLGAAADAENSPQIRITGVFKGADTLSDLIADGSYHTLMTVDAYLGIKLGILNPEFVSLMSRQLAPDEYVRQMLCRNVSARNLIWETKVRGAIQRGLAAGLEIAQPLPGHEYRRRGLISFGYDAAGHGESAHSSKHALVVLEQIGNFSCVIFARQWPAGADEVTVAGDLVGLWEYFRPDYAYGDAYGVGMLTMLCDLLYQRGLTSIDRRAVGDGRSSQSTWAEWPFAPVRFEGSTKHSMAQALRSLFHNDNVAIPYFDDHDGSDVDDLRTLTRQLPNITPIPTSKSYSSYKMANSKLGDDLFDAMMAAVWALATRGGIAVETVVMIRTQRRADLLRRE